MWDNITILQVTHTNDGEYEPEDEADDCDVADGGQGSHQRAHHHLHACEVVLLSSLSKPGWLGNLWHLEI